MCSTWQYVQLLSTTVDSAGTSHWDYKDEQALHRAKGKGVILHDTKKKYWIGHVLRMNLFLKHITEGRIQGRIEVTRRRGRRQADTA